ncbi:MAG: inositol monophosphatase family protein [Candidatus Choladocola sp.]|nr:inositol monophosphatase family protein [Candidatus Choladocola sp.]
MFHPELLDFDMIKEIVKNAAKSFGDRSAADHITVKGLSDYVTEVDTNVQNTLYRELSRLYPDIQFMGEEKDNSEIDFDGPVWILDPVDGTTNLIHRFPGSSISLGLAAGHEMIAGIIYNPYQDELFFAKKGGGAFLNGRPIHTGTSATVSQSLLSTGTSPYYHEFADTVFEQMKNVFLHAQDIRRIGSAAIELAYIACGRLDGYFELLLKPWDFAAGMIILQEAGGRISDYQGRPVFPEQPVAVLATNGLIHEEMIELLK